MKKKKVPQDEFRSRFQVMSLICSEPEVGIAAFNVGAWTAEFCKESEKYPRQVLILLPQGYEPCALPMRHAGEVWLLCLASLSI